jgi:hypothetical protein
MTLTLELSRELEHRLHAEAARLGLPLDQYALRLLTARSAEPKKLSTGADLVAFWEREGVIGSRPDIEDSQVYARELRRRAETRVRS